MSRYNAVKLALAAAFLVVLIGGAVCTAGNIKRWSMSMGAVTGEYVGKGSLKYAREHDMTSENAVSASDDGNGADAAGGLYPEGEDLAYGGAGNTMTGTGSDSDSVGNGGAADTDAEDGYSDGNREETAKTGESAEGETTVVEEDSSESDKDFYISTITDEIFDRINGKSYPKNCPVALSQLRYVHVLHIGFDGRMHVGELIVNAQIAADVLDIFKELYRIKYPIEKLRLVDEYDADDEKSMEDNNSSAFCYRTVAESTSLSVHAYGLAVDINPLYNPYHYTRDDGSMFLQPDGSGAYLDRDQDVPYMIKQGDDCYRIFTSHGFIWGGEWNTKKDYQHFEKQGE